MQRPGLDPFQLSLFQYYVEASFKLDDAPQDNNLYPVVNEAEQSSRPCNVNIDSTCTRDRDDKVNDTSRCYRRRGDWGSFNYRIDAYCRNCITEEKSIISAGWIYAPDMDREG
jgi:hypothetical protein